jgi:hypothetical protein
MDMYSNRFFLEDMHKVFQQVGRNSDILIWTIVACNCQHRRISFLFT